VLCSVLVSRIHHEKVHWRYRVFTCLPAAVLLSSWANCALNIRKEKTWIKLEMRLIICISDSSLTPQVSDKKHCACLVMACKLVKYDMRGQTKICKNIKYDMWGRMLLWKCGIW
jgi:hypothetical protein